MPHDVPLRDLYRGASIPADWWEAAPRLRALLPRHFLDPGAYRAVADLLHARHYERGTVAAAIEDQNRALGADGMSLAAAGRLRDPRALVVIGGQQAGLFGGPLYTLHKALTALALARRLEADLGCPVVPMFWIASDDHDLAEVARTWITAHDGRPLEIPLPAHLAAAATSRRPVAGIALGPDVEEALCLAAAAVDGAPFAGEVMDALRDAYRPGATFAAAFGRWLHRLLAGTGIVTIDPADDRLKRLGVPLFAREIDGRGLVGRAVAEQTARLAAAGYAAQIDVRADLLTLFYHDPGRTAIEVTDGGLRLSGGRRLADGELQAALEREPGRFSPNAALRPLFQDTLLPTVAMVLGPSELAYATQLALAYERVGVPMPVLFPRASVSLVEPRARRLLAAHGLTLAEALSLGRRLGAEVARRAIPEGLAARIASARDAVAAAYAGLVDDVERLDHGLRRTVELQAAYSTRRLDIVEKKTARALLRRDAEVARQAAFLEGTIAPRGGLQERTLCPVGFAARFGLDVAARVGTAVDIFRPAHQGIGI